MKRVQGLIAVCGLTMTLTAAMAVPPVVERLPENALVTVVIPSPKGLHKNLNALATAAEIAELKALPEVDELLMMSGVSAGIDTSKSLAVVMYGPKKLDEAPAKAKAKDGEKDMEKDAKDEAKKDEAKGEDANKTAKPAKKHIIDDEDMDIEEDMDRAVVLIPITKYEEFLGNFNVKPAGEGKVDSFASPTGEDAYSKDIGGGYAVIGSVKELVEQFTGKPGEHSIKSRMGKAGEALSDASDIVAIVNMDRLRPIAMKGMAEMEKEAKDKMETMGGASQEKNLALVKWVGEAIVRDTQMVVSGLKFGASGISVDAVGAFKPESYLAKTFAGTGNSSALLGKLPSGAYLWAGAMDLSTPGMKQLMKDIVSRVELPGGEQAGKQAAANVESSDGMGVTIGFPMGGALAGLLTNTVQFTASKDPAAALKGFKDNLTAMEGQKIENLTYHAKYIENASKAGDTPIDAWETKFEAADGEELPAGMSQAMPFLFGPQGMPVGYVAKGPGGIYSTYAKNTELMTKALDASKGENLSADPMLKQSQEMLPKNRMAEMYVGTKSILDLALPFAAMAGMTVPADKIPEKLPPIAGALSTQDGALRFTMIVPTPVIKTGVFLGKEGQKAMEGAGEDEAPKAKPEKSAGQPKF